MSNSFKSECLRTKDIHFYIILEALCFSAILNNNL